MTYRHQPVSAIVVNYNVRDLLLECVESLVAARDRGEIDEIIVVDSSSSDGSVEALAQRFPEVRVQVVPNRGYGAAANHGMRVARGAYLLVLNSDTLLTPNAVVELARFMQRHPRIGMAGPRLRYPDGTPQPSRRRFPGKMTPLFESTVVQEWFPSNRWAKSYYVEDRPDDRAQIVDWVVGAALMVRREAFEATGGFDESFRMYAEETDWAYRLRNHGWDVAYVPESEIVHHEGASTRQNIPLRQADFDASRVRLQRRIHGRWNARLIAVGLKVSYAVMLARESLKWLIGHRRPLRARRMRLYGRLLVTDLDHHDR